MRVINNLFSIALVFVFVSVTTVNAQTGNIADQKKSVSEFNVNGLTVLVRKRDTAKTVSGGLFIRGGARNIDQKTAGIELLTLRSATEATKNYSRDVLRRELSATGSSLGAGVSNDYGVINFATTSADFDRTWMAFSDVVLNPTFAAEDVERVREVLLTSLRNREDDADSFLDSLQEKIIYAKHPYSNDVSGTIETISAFKPADLKNYHKDMLQTSKLLLVVVGNVDPSVVKSNVEASFGKLPVGKYKETPYPALDFSKGTLDVTSRQLPTNYIKGIFQAPSIAEKDYYPMRVAVTILRNRLFREVRQERQLSYAPSAGLDTFAVNTANIYVTAVNANLTMKVMLDEVKRLRRDEVSPREIESVAGGFLTTYFLDQETNSGQAVNLAKFELIGGGWENSFELLNRINAVTPEDVKDVSRKYMRNLRFVVVGNPIAIERSIFLQNLDEVE
ncbi:MAG: insulinase family protein [Pyrinomonadaceae bacterium]|nr:insulinase family protein [Pyrinomonadaceae bacterium]